MAANKIATADKARASRRIATPASAGKQAFRDFLGGADRGSLLAKLEKRFGIEGVFAFGQAEYYYRKKAA